MAPLYAAFGAHIFETAPEPAGQRGAGGTRERRGTREFAEPILAEAGLPLELAEALDDESWDLEIREETDLALSLTGKDVGTPIIHFEPPAGVAFFGPVISRLWILAQFSQRRACRNASVATTVLTASRHEREESELFVDQILSWR